MCAVIAFAVCFGCRGPGAGARGPAATAVSPVEERFPALRWAPDDASYALTSARTADLVTGIRELASAFALLLTKDIRAVEGTLSATIGFNPLNLDVIVDAGIAVDRSAVVFSARAMPTIVLPVADETKLDQFLDARLDRPGVQVRRHNGRDWFSFAIDTPLSVQWLRWDGFLAIRFSLDVNVTDAAWIDDLFDSANRLGRSPTMARTFASLEARVEKPVLAGVLDLAQLFRGILELAPSSGAKDEIVACLRLFEPLSGAIAIGAHIDWRAASGALSVGLTAEAAQALRRHLVLPPPGYTQAKRDAAVYAGLGVSPAWLEQLRRGAGCALWDRPVTGKRGTLSRIPAGVTGMFMAILDLQMSKRSARGVGYLGLRDRSRADWLLNRIPQRNILERKKTIAGQSVRMITLPYLPEVAYQLQEQSLLLTVGDGLMEQVLSRAERVEQPSTSSLEVASFGIYPSRLPELASILNVIADALSVSERTAALAARQLRRYDHGTVDLSLEGDTLVLRLAMKLAER